MAIPYEFRASPLPEFKLMLPMGTATVLCRSMENWQRIIGTNAAWIGADEIDTFQDGDRTACGREVPRSSSCW